MFLFSFCETFECVKARSHQTLKPSLESQSRCLCDKNIKRTYIETKQKTATASFSRCRHAGKVTTLWCQTYTPPSVVVLAASLVPPDTVLLTYAP